MAKGVVYAVRNDDALVAVDEHTGAILWQRSLSPFSTDDAPGTPAVANGVVYATDFNGVHAIDAATGTPIWTSPGGEFTSPEVSRGMVYVTDRRVLFAWRIGLPPRPREWTHDALTFEEWPGSTSRKEVSRESFWQRSRR